MRFSIVNRCVNLGNAGIFLWQILFTKWRRNSFSFLIEQIYQLGVISFIIILISGLFIGMIIALQGYSVLAKFGTTQQLGQLVALTVIRELGPVVTALLFIGRAGSSLSAEIGLMRTTEQLTSMEMMAVDPLYRIIAPRFWASILSLPILVTIFCVIAIFGGYLVGVSWLGINAGQFWSNMQAVVDFRQDIINGVIIKPLFFGILTAWVAVYQGFYTKPTADGIGTATTRTVVYGSLIVLGADFILTSFMMGGW